MDVRFCKDNIKLELQEMEGAGNELDWSGSEYKQLSGGCENGDEPSVSTKCGVLLN